MIPRGPFDEPQDGEAQVIANAYQSKDGDTFYCPYFPGSWRHETFMTCCYGAEWDKHKKPSRSTNAQFAALLFQNTRTSNGQPKPRSNRRRNSHETSQ